LQGATSGGQNAKFFQTTTGCITLHHAAPRCTTLHHAAPRCTTLHHPAPTTNPLTKV
jgi:hypothetical protein